ncbi:hypothetical protein E2562_019358 [Oryza meyeriana var. granulata]|uniref:Uncharacterized protein n=1 Tax=Oryza meyeriana var. granulata TaxID=110450 RepID=A0A6G1BM88_9ORYZ|nr:hypothetical protein E2562_019358 [Oryza meyeriana var. granulata]
MATWTGSGGGGGRSWRLVMVAAGGWWLPLAPTPWTRRPWWLPPGHESDGSRSRVPNRRQEDDQTYLAAVSPSSASFLACRHLLQVLGIPCMGEELEAPSSAVIAHAKKLIAQRLKVEHFQDVKELLENLRPKNDVCYNRISERNNLKDGQKNAETISRVRIESQGEIKPAHGVKREFPEPRVLQFDGNPGYQRRKTATASQFDIIPEQPPAKWMGAYPWNIAMNGFFSLSKASPPLY